ncbi:MAG: response regulator transcription factor [Chloroflexota bacterium]|nr:response regulator transcription factor [Chloroflexota bacterium]
MMPLNLLIAEDARDVAEVVAFGVRMNWPDCQVRIAASGDEALRIYEEEQVDMAILDITMPPPDGLEVCQRIRETSRIPILILTARDGTLHKVRALDLGADDYLTKPFEHLELLARLRALVRRAALPHVPSQPDLVSGDLTIDLMRHEVRVADEVIALTSTEYRLLEELVRHRGQVLSHQFLLERVWGPAYVHDTHYLKVYISRLRQKLGDDAESPRYIETVWGTGYCFLPSS